MAPTILVPKSAYNTIQNSRKKLIVLTVATNYFGSKVSLIK